ncbi:hypothetical protein, partial [Sphingobacterium faecium]|uniref:hypothetical protein n=1 Tax=Sphingobacterium faecium TaxID=34087 RepID=UPI001B87ED55
NPSFFSASPFGSAVPPLRSGAKIGTFILHFLTFYGNSLPRHGKELEMWMIILSKWTISAAQVGLINRGLPFGILLIAFIPAGC